MAKQFRFELDEGKDLIASFHEGAMDQSKNSTFDKFVTQVRIKFFTEIPQEYEQKLKMPTDQVLAPDINEEYKSLNKIEDGNVSERSRENSGTMLELDPNAKVLSILRERNFLEVLIESITSCDVDKLANIMRVIQITRSFSSIGFFVCEQAGVQDCILNLFDTKIEEGIKLHPAYEVLAKLSKQSRSNQIRAIQAWKFLMRITDQIVDHCSKSQKAQCLLQMCFQTICQTVKSHPNNSVYLHDQKALDPLKQWIIRVANLQMASDSDACLQNLLQLAATVLERIQDKQLSHQYALIVTNLLLSETKLTISAKYQLLLFTSKILKENIQQIETTSKDGILRFVNDEMKAVFINSVLMLQDAINPDQSLMHQDQKLQILTVSVALLALEVQIKIKQVYLQPHRYQDEYVSINPQNIDKSMLYSNASSKQIDFENIIKRLLKAPKVPQKTVLNEYRGASAQPTLTESNYSTNQMVRLYIASRIVVAMQASKQLTIASIISMLTNQDTLSEDQLNPFLTMIILEQNNPLSYLIQDSITSSNVQVLESFCDKLMRAIGSKVHADVLHCLLSLTLLTSGNVRCKSKIDEILNLQEIVLQIDIIAYSFEQQLFILQCLVELNLENWVFHDQLDSLSAVMEQEAKSHDRKFEFDQFRQFLQQASNIDQMDFDEIDRAFESGSGKKTDEIPVELTIIKDQECRMRESPKSFNYFLLCLGQAHQSVQILIFEDLTSLANQSLRNKRIMVQSMPQSFLLYLLHSAQQDQQLIRSLQKFDNNYIQYLSNFIQCLFSYGVLMNKQDDDENETNKKRISDLQLFLWCLSYGRRLNYLFVESLIQTLSKTRSSVKKYVKLANECPQNLRTCLPPNERAIGVATWINLESIQQLSLNPWSRKNCTTQISTPVLTVQLDEGLEIDVTLLQEIKNFSIIENHQNGFGSIAGESSIRSDSYDLSQDVSSQDHENRQDLDAYQRLRATLSQRYGSAVCEEVSSIQLVVYRTQLTKEVILKKQADLEEMIATSVFNNQQFNHYCIQVYDNRLQFHINGHQCLHDMDISASKIKSLVLEQQVSVSKIAFFDQAKSASDIEKLMDNLNDEINDFNLEEVPTWQIQIFQPENEKSPQKVISPQKSSPQKRRDRSLKMKLDDGSFYVPLMTCSDQSKIIRVMIQQQSVTIRKATSHEQEGYIENLIRQGNCEVFQETKNLLTLKKCMSGEEIFKSILHILEYASNDEEALLLSFRLLASLLIRNQNNALTVFEKLNGFKRLENLLLSKICEMHNNQLKRVFAQIIEIACNELNSSLRIDPNANQQKRSTIAIPLLDESIANGTQSSRLAFLNIALTLVKSSPVDQGSYFLQMLHQLLCYDRNLKVFHRNFNLQPVLDLFGVIESNYRLLNLYDCTLALFELFIDGIRRNLFESAKKDLELALDFILTMDIRSQSESQNLSSTIQTRVIIDCLSIIAIHILSDNQACSLINNLMNFDLVALALMLLNKEEIEIREYAVKFFQLLLLKSPDGFAKQFIESRGFLTLGAFLLNPQNLQPHQGNQLVRDNQDDGQGIQTFQKVSLNLAQILLEASVCRYDNVNEMSPENQTLVHQVMNQSRIAEKVVQQIKVSLKTPKRTVIKFFDLLTTYVLALQFIESDSSRYMCLKSLQHLLCEIINPTAEFKQTNMDQLLLVEGLLQRFVQGLHNFQLAVAKLSGYHVSESHKLLKHVAHHSASDDNFIEQNDSLIVKFKQETQKNFSRSVDCALEIITQVFVLDMLKPTQQSQTIQVLLNFPQDDDLLQFQALTRIFRHYQKNPQVSDQNTLTNLHHLIASFDDLISVEQNPQIILRAINLINLMAFKSSMQVRKLMKDLKLLEQRDLLIIRKVQSTLTHLYRSKQPGYNELMLVKAVSKFSYETLASKPVFVANFCTEYLCLILLLINQPIFDREDVVLLRQELFSRLFDEVLQFDQNCIDTELVGSLKTYLNDRGDQQLYDKLVSKFQDKIRDYSQQRLQEQIEKENERTARKKYLINKRIEEEHVTLSKTEALKIRVQNLQRQMLGNNSYE